MSTITIQSPAISQVCNSRTCQSAAVVVITTTAWNEDYSVCAAHITPLVDIMLEALNLKAPSADQMQMPF